MGVEMQLGGGGGGGSSGAGGGNSGAGPSGAAGSGHRPDRDAICRRVREAGGGSTPAARVACAVGARPWDTKPVHCMTALASRRSSADTGYRQAGRGLGVRPEAAPASGRRSVA